MAKPDKPLLSFEARGTISDTLTFQKRGQLTIARKKPIPTDPKSPAQLAQRQIYRDAVDAWHALTPEEKEAWRGVCPGLTAYQCFMSSQLKYVAPPIPIDIGALAIDRTSNISSDFTLINMQNPANATGALHTIKVYAYQNISRLRVGTFYTTNANTLKCRDSVLIANVEAGAERTFTELFIPVETGDYIGCYFSTGWLEADTAGFDGIWYIYAEHIDPNDEAQYSFLPGYAISLYGIGEAVA